MGKQVLEPESITGWAKSKHGVVMNEQQLKMPVRPPPKQVNFSYHHDPTLYQWLGIMRGLQRLKPRYIKRKFQSDAAHIEYTRQAFHLLKCQQIAKGNKNPNPRADLEEGLDNVTAVFYPKKQPSGGVSGAFKVASIIVPAVGSKQYMRHLALNRIRQTIRDEIPRKSVLPVGFMQEINRMKANAGPAAERRDKFHETCVEYRAHLFRR